MRYTMKQAAEKTGLSAHTIRAWERRYAALTPARTDTDRRVFSDEEIERLRLLAGAVLAGHSISSVASLSNDYLKNILEIAEGADTTQSNSTLNIAMKAVEDFDAEYLQFILARGAATRGLKALIETVIVPLLSIIGQRWEQGTMRVGQEHLASSVIRTYLEQTLHSIAPQNSSSRILVTTPSGQLHELGALMAGVYASLEGWNVIYLGANTPSKDIVEVAQNANVSAIALSIVCPEQDQGLTMELRDIRRGVGPKMPVFVGGRAARCYEVILKEIGSQRLSDLKMFGALLNKVDLVSI